jgi:hypothetical protein
MRRRPGVRLRARLERRLGAAEAELPVHVDATRIEVGVLPGDPRHLAAPHAGRGEQQPGGAQPIGLDVLEKGPQLRRGPPRGSLTLDRRRMLEAGRRAGEDLAPLHRGLERAAEDAVGVDDGLGRVARAVTTAGALQRVVEAFEIPGCRSRSRLSPMTGTIIESMYVRY